MFRLTFHGGKSFLVDEDARIHFLRVAIRRRHDVTRVRGGHVVTLPGGRMVALIAESASNV
ncbi:hypothetical protein ACGFZB_28900 [Streptomyces cinerochromogenes]|uniref:16S rRNA (Uracil(1498)-N(3))-methyltransferase n=1 Tax=Streptomyces cinerochromogenes TaxID=66422 RepID=A0ABW7BAY6_9ACTN